MAGSGESRNENNRNGNLKIIEVELKKQGGYALRFPFKTDLFITDHSQPTTQNRPRSLHTGS